MILHLLNCNCPFRGLPMTWIFVHVMDVEEVVCDW